MHLLYTHRLSIEESAANEDEARVNKILVGKQIEKVEAMETIVCPLAEYIAVPCTGRRGRDVEGKRDGGREGGRKGGREGERGGGRRKGGWKEGMEEEGREKGGSDRYVYWTYTMQHPSLTSSPPWVPYTTPSLPFSLSLLLPASI